MIGPEQAAAIFDLDGVIVDSAATHRDSWAELMRELNRPFEEPIFWQTFGLRNDVILQKLIDPDLAPHQIRRLGARKEEIFRMIGQGRLQPLPGAAACVLSVGAAGWLRAIASSAPRANIMMILDALRLGGEFDAVVSGEEVTRGKPDPEIFLRAASALKVPARRCVVVEDAAAGIEAARRAGMAAVAVTRDDPVPHELRNADLIVRTLAELRPADLLRLVNTRVP